MHDDHHFKYFHLLSMGGSLTSINTRRTFRVFFIPFSKSSYCRHAYEMMSTFFFFFPSSSVGIVPASLLLATRAGGFKCFHLYSGFFSRSDPLSIGAIVFFNHSFQYYFLHRIYNKNSFSFIKDRNDEKESSKQ